MNKFHLRARALILNNKSILLAHRKGANNTYLPGGHIEIGESAAAALKRELREETGKDIDIKGFLGCIEADWEQNGLHNYELNLVFKAVIKGSDYTSIESQEDHLEFLWCPVEELRTCNLLPKSLQVLLEGLFSGDESIWWESTLE